MKKRIFLWAFAVLLLGAELCPALDKNIAADYGAVAGQDIAAVLQQAVDDVGKAGGGTVVIPGGSWQLWHPVFVSYPNVTIAGEGNATRIQGMATMFLLGVKRQYDPSIAEGHFPPITGESSIFDESVKGTHYGLRTFDGTTRAAGFFPSCGLAHGGRIPHTEGDNYWADYAKGVGNPTWWANWQHYTFNLIIKNNGSGPMRGTICGAGAGSITPEMTTGTVADPLTVWTIESDPQTGRNLAFKFNTVNADGKQSVHQLLLSAKPVGPGVHRVSVQLDFETGRCRAWFSTSTDTVVQPRLVAKLDMGEGSHFRKFEYGAFRLGRVTANPFAGTPSDGTAENGDWTYGGFCMAMDLLYATDHENDTIGSVQKNLADGEAPTDEQRYLPNSRWPYQSLHLKLDGQPTNMIVKFHESQKYRGLDGCGYWLPDRSPDPIGGVISVRDLQLFPGHGHGCTITIGEARNVLISGIYNGGSSHHTIGAWPCTPNDAVLEVNGCRVIGHGASILAYNQTLKINELSGGGGDSLLRLIGCRGAVSYTLITGFTAADHYVKIQSGPTGGPLTFDYFCIDNEGLSWVPRRAIFYAEPSLNPSEGGNLLRIRGGIYTGALFTDQAIFELADPPTGPDPNVRGRVSVDYIDLMANDKRSCGSVFLCSSPYWSGSLWNVETNWIENGALSYGLIRYTGPAAGAQVCELKTYSTDTSSLPTKGTWLAGCHQIRIPSGQETKTGRQTFTIFECTKTGTCGTANPPQWKEVQQ